MLAKGGFQKSKITLTVKASYKIETRTIHF